MSFVFVRSAMLLRHTDGFATVGMCCNAGLTALRVISAQWALCHRRIRCTGPSLWRRTSCFQLASGEHRAVDIEAAVVQRQHGSALLIVGGALARVMHAVHAMQLQAAGRHCCMTANDDIASVR